MNKNHLVPHFEMNADYSLIPTSPSSSSHSPPHPIKYSMQGEQEEMRELLWQNSVAAAQRSLKRSQQLHSNNYYYDAAVSPSDQTTSCDIRLSFSSSSLQQQQQQQQELMQEEEMASWLHYPLNDTNFVVDDPGFGSDLLYPTPSSVTTATASAVPVTDTPQAHDNLAAGVSEKTVARSSSGASCRDVGFSGGAMAAGCGVRVIIDREMTTATTTVTSSPGAEDRKRKGKEEERDTDVQSEV